MKTLCDKRLQKEIRFGERTLVMGILNITPDSFYDGGRFFSAEKAAARALEIERQGADIIDLGGESSRPGSMPVTVDQEIARVIPVIGSLKDRLSIPVSLDTSRSEVVKEALAAGCVDMVNDVYACRRDPRVAELAAEHGFSLVLMHMKGEPMTMQNDPGYDDLIPEIIRFFEERTAEVKKAGVLDRQIILDPGIGFGKRLEDNVLILRTSAG